MAHLFIEANTISNLNYLTMQQLPKTARYLSLLAATLALLTSLLGLFDPSIYAQETENWARQARGQDIGNLLAVLVLFVALRQKGDRVFLIWQGTLFYLVYAFMIYAFALHFNVLFLAYVGVLGCSAYAWASALLQNPFASMEHREISRGRTRAGWILMLIGVLFGLLWLAEIIPALIYETVPASMTEAGRIVNPVHVIDLALVLPAMIISGRWLQRGKRAGDWFGPSWLVFSVLMGLSIVATMLLELLRGNQEVLPVLILVGIVVLASGWGFRQTAN